MKQDPAEGMEFVKIKPPPLHGPGSSKEAWVAFAQQVAEANVDFQAVIKEQAALIKALRHGIAATHALHGKRLQEQLAAKKPKGGRPKLPDETVQQIEEALLAGHSTRRIGERFKVSAMTVSRVRKAMDSRVAQSA